MKIQRSRFIFELAQAAIIATDTITQTVNPKSTDGSQSVDEKQVIKLLTTKILNRIEGRA